MTVIVLRTIRAGTSPAPTLPVNRLGYSRDRPKREFTSEDASMQLRTPSFDLRTAKLEIGTAYRLLIFARARSRLRTRRWLRTARAEVVVIQCGVEQHEECSLRLMPPHRIGRKHHNMAF